MPKVKDLMNNQFGRLTVVEYVGIEKHRAMWRCECECGNEVVVASDRLRSGNVQSCGCYQKERQREVNTKHGDTYTKLYNAYHHMLSRCSNPNDNMYRWYGGRGISVCAEWEQSYEAFKEWALANGYDDSLSIDRIDEDGNYEPANVQWILLRDNVAKMLVKRRERIGKKLPAGVYQAKNGRYRSHAFNVYLGTYDTIDEAVAARGIAAAV